MPALVLYGAARHDGIAGIFEWQLRNTARRQVPPGLGVARPRRWDWR